MAKEESAETLSAEKRKKSMLYCTADGIGYSVMGGTGDAFVSAAAVGLGAGNFYLGMLSALPQLFGALAQFGSLGAMRLMKDRKLLVLAGSLAHALSWFAIAAVMLWPGELSVPALVLLYSLGSAISLFINPAWSSWISDMVPESERSHFFAGRMRAMQFALFTATFASGLLLRQLELGFAAGIAFAAIFTIAGLARLTTVYFNSRVEDVKYELLLFREIKLTHLFLLPAYRHELWFLAFTAMTSFTVQFCSPFFTPYMLSDLGFDVGMLGILTAIAVLTKIVAFPYWGKIVDRFGNRMVLIATSFSTALIPLMWLVSKDPAWLGAFQVFSGFAWAGFDLASFNFALSLVGRELRPSFISKYNAFNGVFYALGAAAGGLFLVLSGPFSFLGFAGIPLVLLLSGVMRLLVSLIFAPRLSVANEPVNKSEERAMVFKIVAVYPTQGAVQQALDGWNFTRKIVASGTARGGRILKGGLEATGGIVKEGGKRIISRVERKKRL